MSPGFIGFVSVLVVLQLALPKKYAFLPLMLAGLHLGNGEFLPQLSTGRLLILVGLVRAIAGGFIVWPGKSALDKVFYVFSFFVILSTIGHKADAYFPSPLNARLGLVFNTFGTYLYARSYIPDIDAFKRYGTILLFALIPLAICMTLEQKTQKNYYYLLGARSETVMSREGKMRAQGPFQHPILAGTAAATAMPFAFLMWRIGRRKTALIGMGACMGVVLACASSGPLAAVAVTFAAAALWRWRQHLKYVLWGIVALAVLFNIVKGRGPWFIMASLDLVGGSTGWHRAQLIDQGFKYLSEWWLFGTDYTRHWMASGVRWNPNMVDLTNYYLHLGVTGGLPVTLCLIGFLVISFRTLAKRMKDMRETADEREFVLWCAGTSLAAHAISFISISYFDQMYIYFYLMLGIIVGLAGTPSVLKSLPRETTQLAEPEPVKPVRFYS